MAEMSICVKAKMLGRVIVDREKSLTTCKLLYLATYILQYSSTARGIWPRPAQAIAIQISGCKVTVSVRS